jgi:hypothetical protein
MVGIFVQGMHAAPIGAAMWAKNGVHSFTGHARQLAQQSMCNQSINFTGQSINQFYRACTSINSTGHAYTRQLAQQSMCMSGSMEVHRLRWIKMKGMVS